MAREDIPELVSPKEGFSTLSAQITRQSVDRITHIIKREKEKGRPVETIALALKRDLIDYDEHTRALLLSMASTDPLEDDFTEANVVSREATKPGRVVLTVTENPSDLNLYSLVRYLGKEWLIVECRENKWTLKAL